VSAGSGAYPGGSCSTAPLLFCYTRPSAKHSIYSEAEVSNIPPAGIRLATEWPGVGGIICRKVLPSPASPTGVELLPLCGICEDE
jgi:hypothetical protein